MRRARLIFSILAVVAVTIPVGSGEVSRKPSASTPAESFLASRWTQVTAPANVDPAVLRALTGRFGKDKRLAGPGEPFEATDVESGRPSRRFLLAGCDKGKWFVAYERGGRGHHVVLAIFDSRATPPTPSLLARGSAGSHDDVVGWRVTIDELKAAVKTGRLTLIDTHDASF